MSICTGADPAAGRPLLGAAILAAAATAHGAGPADLQAQAPAPASIEIDAGRVEGTISPLLYGQFLEFMFEGVKGGITAELLRDRGFDQASNAIGLPRDWNRYPDDRNDDYGLNFLRDDTVAYPVDGGGTAGDTTGAGPARAQWSLRVTVGGGVVERHGLYQSRIPVRAGHEYRGYVWLRTSGYRGPVLAALEQDVTGGPTYAEAAVVPAEPGAGDGEWRRYHFLLRPDRTDPLARFALLFPGEGTVWVDQVSLLPADAVGGVRLDVMERVADLEPAFLRWPGGNVAQDYHWTWGVGPRDRRPTWTNLSWKNEPEPGDFGTDEYVAFSRRVGAQPTLTVNVEGRGATAKDAAAWVEYTNGPISSPNGARRAENGHAEPYGIRYWELGNEIWGDWVRGHSDAATYAANYRRYHAAMRAVDPSIRFIAVGDNDMEWNRTVLREAGDRIDYLAIHHYYGRHPMAGDLLNLMARPLFYERFYRDVARVIEEEAPGRTIRLAINEWGLDLPESQQYSIVSALYAARLMNVFERASPLVGMTAVSDLVNGWPGGIIQASRHGVFVTPIYHVNRMYAGHRGDERLRTEVQSPTFDSSREGEDVPVLDAVASRSAADGLIYVKLVNTDLTRDLDVRVHVVGTRIRPDATLELLTAPDLETTVGFRTPEVIRPVRVPIEAGNAFRVRLPKHSVGVLALRVAP